VQNSPPNKCIPRILFGNYRKEEKEKTQTNENDWSCAEKIIQ
jgi:hypothetical protein